MNQLKQSLIAAVVFLLFAFSAKAQYPVTVTTIVAPPYSPYLSSYVDQPGKVSVILTNTSGGDLSIKLWVRIAGDNGVSATTAPGFNPSEPIALGPYQTRSLDFSQSETHNYFDPQNVILTGITKSQLIQNQALPEGNYQICVKALDYNRGAALSLDGAGCSAIFPIFYIDPPAPVQPSCGTFVTPTTPQFVLFSWTPPATAQGLINYEFTLKEVPNNLNPYDVIKMSIYPVLFNTTQTSNNTLVYSAAFPQLEEGKKYVWQVRAIADGMQFKNNGYSDACSFTWGTQSTFLMNTDAGNSSNLAYFPIQLKTPAKGATVDAVLSETFSNYPNHYLFEWYAPAVMNKDTPLMAYHLRIAHVSPGQTAKQALAIDSQVTVKSIEGSLSYHYNKLSDFKVGETYAWEVKGVSNVSGGDKVYYSDQWTFKVKHNHNAYKIKGTLYYSYSLPPTATFSWGSSGGIGSSSIGMLQSNIDVGPATQQSFPYANKKISLFKSILVKEGNSSKVAYDETVLWILQKMSGGESLFKDAGDFAGTVTTDANGHFEINTDAILGDVLDTTENGKVCHFIKALKILVSDKTEWTLGGKYNPYVNNPDEYIVVDGNQTEITKSFYARVKSYKLNVTFNELPQKSYYNKPIPASQHPNALTMYVLRTTRYPLNKMNPHAFPHNEGESTEASNETIDINGHTYEVISKKPATVGVPCKFDDLVVSDMDMWNDRIFVYAQYANDPTQIMTPVKYKTGDWQSGSGSSDMTFQPSSDWQKAYNKGNYTRELTIVPDQLTSTVISGKLSAHWDKTISPPNDPNNKQNRALANTSVALKAYYVIQKPDGTEEFAKNLPSSITNSTDPDCYGVTQTDENGNFKFNLNVYSDSSTQSSRIGFIKPYGGGNLYRVLKVVVNSPYYYSPDNSFVVDGGYQYEVGELIANVREGYATGRLVEQYTNGQSQWKPIANQRVKLCRWDWDQNAMMPKDEGDINTVIDKTVTDPDGWHYIVLEETTTKSDGTFFFSRLGFAESWTDPGVSGQLYLYAEPDEVSTNNYKTQYPVAFPNTTASQAWNGFNQFNSQQPADMHYINYDYFEAEPLLPTIRGSLHPASNMGYSTLADAHVILYQYTDLGVKSLNDIQYDADHEVPAWEFKDELARYGPGGCENWFHLYKYDEQITTDNGKFLFQNLPVKTWGGQPYHYMVYVQKNGFLDEARIAFGKTPSASPKKGQQETMMLDLRLPVTVRTKVVEQGTNTGVMAKVIVGDNYSWAKTTATNCDWWICDATIDLKCPIGKVKVYIYPENMDMYLPDSATINVKWGDAEGVYKGIQQLSVRPRTHDIEFMVYDKNDQSLLDKMGAQLINANVTAFTGQQCTYEQGKPQTMLFNHIASCQFKSNATKFEFIVYGEKGGVAYVPKQMTVNSDPQFYDGWDDIAVFLEPGLTISGFVKNSKGGGVEGVHVYVEDKFVSTPVETVTAADGSYTLAGVPRKNGLVIRVAKPSSNLIGDFTQLTTSSIYPPKYIKLSTSTSYTHDFIVTECTTMDISSILGFPMEVSSFAPDGTGGGKISGRVVNLPDNDIVKNKDGTTMQFTSVDVKPGTTNGPSGKPISEPKTLPVYTDELAIKLKLYNNTIGTLMGTFITPLTVDKETISIPSGNQYTQPQKKVFGSVKGFLMVDGNSFPKGGKFESSYISAWPKGKTIADMYMAFTSDKSKPLGMFGFRVANYNGQNLKFNLFNRYPGSEADAANSLLLNDELKLSTIVHTNLSYVDEPDIHLNVGEIKLTTDGSVSGPANGNSEIKIPLGKWSLTSTDWKCTEYEGLVLKNSTVNTGISVPMKNMSITNTGLMFGEPQIDNLSLAGIVQLNLEPGTIKSFGFDKGIGNGAWSFVMLPAEGKPYCAKFGDLPGMTGGTFKVASVRSYSNGYPNKIMLMSDNQPVTINQVATFGPGSMDAGSDNIKMQGQIDFGVPSLKYDDNFTINWIKKDGNITTNFENPSAMSLKAKGVYCDFPATPGKYIFEDGKFELTGTLRDEADAGNYAFAVKLLRTPVSTTIKTYTDNAVTFNRFYFKNNDNSKGVELTNDPGDPTLGMGTLGSIWTPFKFKGELFGMGKGIADANKHVEMVIKGDVVADPKSRIGVEGVEGTPMGNLSFVYDVNQGAFVGSSHLEANAGAESIKYDVEMMMGSGNWFFFGSGQINFPPDFWISQASAAMFVGKVDNMPVSITNKFKEFSVTGNLSPAVSTSNFTGLITACGMKMPIPHVPQFNISVGPFGSAGVDHQICANIIASINFNSTPTLALNVNGSAYLKVYAGASIGVGCVHAEGDVTATVDVNGSINKNAVAISGDVGLKIHASGVAGVGCCDSDCDHPWYCPCVKGGIGLCVNTSAHIAYSSSSGADFHIEAPSFNLGDCP